MKKSIIFVLVFLLHFPAFSQSISRIEPPNWWTGMKWNTVTLLIYGENISELQPTFDYPEVELIKKEKTSNKNYLFVTIKIDPSAKAGDIKINFRAGNKIIISKSPVSTSRRLAGFFVFKEVSLCQNIGKE